MTNQSDVFRPSPSTTLPPRSRRIVLWEQLEVIYAQRGWDAPRASLTLEELEQEVAELTGRASAKGYLQADETVAANAKLSSGAVGKADGTNTSLPL